jgi:hypothetical protein
LLLTIPNIQYIDSTQSIDLRIFNILSIITAYNDERLTSLNLDPFGQSIIKALSNQDKLFPKVHYQNINSKRTTLSKWTHL